MYNIHTTYSGTVEKCSSLVIGTATVTECPLYFIVLSISLGDQFSTESGCFFFLVHVF